MCSLCCKQYFCSLVSLQNQLEERTAHNESLAEYECEIKDLEKNLSDAIIANAGEPMVSYEPKFVHQQIRDNQVML